MRNALKNLVGRTLCAMHHTDISNAARIAVDTSDTATLRRAFDEMNPIFQGLVLQAGIRVRFAELMEVTATSQSCCNRKSDRATCVVFGAEFENWLLMTYSTALYRIGDALDADNQFQVDELELMCAELKALAKSLRAGRHDFTAELTADYFPLYLMAYGRTQEWRESGLTLQDVTAAY